MGQRLRSIAEAWVPSVEFRAPSRARPCQEPARYGQSARALGVHLPKPLATMLRMTAQT